MAHVLSAPSRKRTGKPRAKSAPAQTKAVDATIGRRIRQIRRERGLQLETLAAKTGLSIGYLSQIERGLSSPTLRALASLTDLFGVSLGELFGALVSPGSSDAVVVREAERPTLALWRDGIYKQILASPGEDSRITLILVLLEPGADTGPEMYTHKGEEAGMVLAGQMTLTVGTCTWALKKGDSFRFPSTTPHRFANPGRSAASVMWMNCA